MAIELRKVSDEKILESYSRLKNIWKVAAEVGLCAQSVHERLKKLNVTMSIKFLTDQEKELIASAYKQNFERGDEILNNLTKKIGHNKQVVSRFAKKIGLTSYKRKLSLPLIKKNSTRQKLWIKTNGHPKGMLGKTHTKEYSEECARRAKVWHQNATTEQKRMKIKKMFISKIKKYGTIAPAPNGQIKTTWRQGWREIGGKKIYFRSAWEANYARYLEFQKKNSLIADWLHEPQTFWFEKIKRGSITYLPDFKVINNDGSHYWVEVKGWMDARSKTKINRFRKYFPAEKLIVIDSKWYRKNSKKLSGLILDWENKSKGLVRMPLLKGKKNIGHNIKAEEAAGKKHAQAVAIALSQARKSGAKIKKKK